MSPKKVEQAAEGIRSRFAESRRGTGLISASVALAMTLASAMPAGHRKPRSGPGPRKQGRTWMTAASRDILQALQSLRAAVRAEKSPESKAARPLPSRPERTVTPPTLTSADLDRMLEQYLAKTNPKVEPRR